MMKIVRPVHFVPAVACAWCVLLAGCSVKPREEAPVAPTQGAAPAPSGWTVLHGGDSSTLSRADLSGKVVLLDFWATWSAPAVAERAQMESIHQAFKDQNFTVLGMLVDREEPQVLAPAVARLGVTYPVVKADEAALADYGNIRAIPSKVLLDRQGRVATNFGGMVAAEVLRAEIGKLVAP